GQTVGLVLVTGSSVMLTVLIVLIAVALGRRSKYGWAGRVCALGVFVGWPWTFFPPNSLGCLLCMISAFICKASGARPRTFVFSSIAGMLAGYSLFAWGIFSEVSSIKSRDELRRDYPLESLS